MTVETSHRRLFVVGAMKSGTSALADALGRSGSVFVPWSVEPGYYFWRTRGAPTGPGDRGGYASSIVKAEEYEALFRDAPDGQWLLDGSTQYYQSPEAITAIASEHPDSHVVLCLREPGNRAWSAYSHLRRDARETLTFAAALEAEEERRSAGWEPLWWYRRGSDYLTALGNLEKHFAPDHVHVVLFEQLVADPAGVLADLQCRLGIPTTPGSLQLDVVNASGSPRLRWLFYGMSATSPFRLRLKRRTPERLVRAVRGLRAALLQKDDIVPDENALASLRQEAAPMLEELERRGIPAREHWAAR